MCVALSRSFLHWKIKFYTLDDAASVSGNIFYLPLQAKTYNLNLDCVGFN